MATRRNAPLEPSVACRIAVWLGASARARMRTLARPVPSVTAVVVVARISGNTPLGDVMKLMSPETASNRTTRPASAMPACERVTETSASPPEQSVPGGQPAGCVDAGVTRMSLVIVPGFTVTTAVASGAVPASRTVTVTLVSAGTALGTTLNTGSGLYGTG